MAHQGGLPPLVRAKLSPPKVADACVRPETLALLERSFQGRMTLACAPAGYGKTTVVLEGLRRMGLRSIWYKLDVLDRDPAALIASLLEALRGHYEGFGQTIRDRLANAHDVPYPVEQLTAEFVAEATERIGDDVLFVLDDYHEAADSRDLNGALDYLIANLPPTVRFVVLSRYEPAFEVGKLRLQGQITVIGVEELRFGEQEVMEVVKRRADVTLTRDRAAALADLTEGWPASVVLAALAARWVGAEGLENALSDPRLRQDVFSYLAEQVYSRQPDEVRAFLRRTCCLEHLSVDLAERVGAPRRAHRILNRLLANGVFTFATAQEGTYRYHGLFREFLRRKTIQEDGPERFHSLQLSTAAALEGHGDAERAIDLYLAANEPRLALEAVARAGETNLDAFRSDTLQTWIDRLPDDIRRHEPWAHLMTGEVEMRAGDFDAALENTHRAMALLRPMNDRRGLYRALSAKERTLFWKGETTEAAEACREALEMADDGEQRVHALISLGAALNAECRWSEATQALEEASRLADGGLPREQARLAAYEVFIAHNSGRYRAAADAAKAAAPVVSRHGSPSLKMAFLNLTSANRLFMADWAGARQGLIAARELGNRYGFAFMLALVDDADAQLLACSGDTALSAELCRQAMGAPSIASDAYSLSMAITHFGTAERRSGNRLEALAYYARAADAARGTGARNARLNALANLAYVRGLEGEATWIELQGIAHEARELDLLFVALKAEFFSCVLRYYKGESKTNIATLVRCVTEQLELGHLNFLAQELVLEPSTALALLAAIHHEPQLQLLLDLLASHPKGLSLLIASLSLGVAQGIAATRAAVAHRTRPEYTSVLAKALKSPHREIRLAAMELRRAARRESAAAAEGALDLTPRETQILSLIAGGATNQDIARLLVLSPATVKTHINHIFSKLSVRDRLQAALAYSRAMGGREADAASHLAPTS